MAEFNLIKILIQVTTRGKNRIEINIPNVITSPKFGKSEVHYISPESLDAGLPIVIDTTFPVRVSNVLFVAAKEKASNAKVLYHYALPQFITVERSATIRVPWIEAFKASEACLAYEDVKSVYENFYIVAYDQFTNKWYRSARNFTPLFMHSFAIECDSSLDKKYEEVFGYSLRKLRRAKTYQERRKILGISEKDIQEIVEKVRTRLRSK